MPARKPRDAVVSQSAGTCLSCGRTLLASDHFCGGCGTPAPPRPTLSSSPDAEPEHLGEEPQGPPRKPEILGLWREPEPRSPVLKWLLWAGPVLVVAVAYLLLRGPSTEPVAIIEIPRTAADSFPRTAPITPTAPSADNAQSGTGSAGPAVAEVAALDVVPGQARIAPGSSVRFKVLATNRSGTPVTGREVEWRSDAPQVVTVSRTGVVTGVTPGGAIVTATIGGRSASAMVTVGLRGNAALVVQPTNVSIAVKQTARLNAVVRDESGNVMTPHGVEWSSSGPSIAAVSPVGVVTGVAPGVARISVRGEGLTATPVTVTVKGAGPAVPAPVAFKSAIPAAPLKGVARPAAPVKPGVLQMLVTPWAMVSVDGRAGIRRARGIDTLPAGRHRLRFERPGFVTIDTSVTVGPGELRIVDIQLIPRKP
jgi:hypothetical protein